MSKLKDMSGYTFNNLKVLKRVENSKKNSCSRWLCLCNCGKEVIMSGNAIRNHKQKSCGCLTSLLISKYHSTHKLCNTTEYRSWAMMKKRCLNKKMTDYIRYGGRGIKVCDRWINSFEDFLTDMGTKPTPKHSIDRIDNNGNYEPSNCRWATALEQNKNQRSNVWITYKGETMIMKDWSKKLNTVASHIKYYLKKGLSFDEVFNILSKRK